jgi:predicted transcriptional regulator
MARPRNLGELQHAILSILWDSGEATVADVHAALHPERPLALTTIATMLRKMEGRELVTHRTEGRQFVYRAALQRDRAHREMVSDVVDRVFQGDATALVSHLLREGEFEPTELEALRRMIVECEQAESGGGLGDPEPGPGGGR